MQKNVKFQLSIKKKKKEKIRNKHNKTNKKAN